MRKLISIKENEKPKFYGMDFAYFLLEMAKKNNGNTQEVQKLIANIENLRTTKSPSLKKRIDRDLKAFSNMLQQ